MSFVLEPTNDQESVIVRIVMAADYMATQEPVGAVFTLILGHVVGDHHDADPALLRPDGHFGDDKTDTPAFLIRGVIATYVVHRGRLGTSFAAGGPQQE